MLQLLGISTSRPSSRPSLLAELAVERIWEDVGLTSKGCL